MLQREGALDALLKAIVDVYKEVHASERLDFVYGGSGLLHRLLGIGVGVIEADGFFFTFAQKMCIIVIQYYIQSCKGVYHYGA